MIALYSLIVALISLHLHVKQCSAISEESVAIQLAYLTEKYQQLDSKYEKMEQNLKDLSRENLYLRNHLEEITIENKNIQAQLKNRNDDEKDMFRTPNNIEFNNLQTDWKSNRHQKDPKQSEYLNRVTYTNANKQGSPAKAVPRVRLAPLEEDDDGTNPKKRLLIDTVTTPSPDVPRVAFAASLTTALSLGQHQIVEYNKVLTNIGHAYDSRHGHFIAPTRGVYLMSFTLMNNNGETMDIEMVKNGIRIAYGYGDSSGYNMGTQVTIVLLEKGDMIWVRHAKDSVQTLNGYEYNTFAGTLLFQM